MHLLIHAACETLQVNNIQLICTDPPYGSTQNIWDTNGVDCVEQMLLWKLNNIHLVTTADMQFAAQLINKHIDLFSHDLVWEKTIGSGQLNINSRPLRLHEHILIFKRGKAIYNRLKEEGLPYNITRNITTTQCYGKQHPLTIANVGTRDVKTILKIPNPRVKGGHPTQKPVALFQKLCDMYSNEDSVVLDPFCGSGTILDVRNRVTIGAEKNEEYFRAAKYSRANRLCEKTTEWSTYFKQFIPNLEDYQYAIFSPESTETI